MTMFKMFFDRWALRGSSRRLFGSWVLGLVLVLGLAACKPKSTEAQSGPAVEHGVAQAASTDEARPAIMQVGNMDQFKSEVLNKPGKTVVDFYATWCGPCKQYSPILENMAEQKLPGVNFKKVDVDKAKDIASEYGIEAMPTTIIFENGKEVRRFLGVQSESTLKEALGV